MTTVRALTTPNTTPTTSTLITTITSLLQILTTHQNPETSPLNQFSPYLKPKLVIKIIKNQPNPNQALLFFNWAKNPKPNPTHYSHTHFCYIAITDFLISHNLLSSAQTLLESSNNLSDFFIGKLIKAYGNLNDIRAAVNLLNRAKVIENGKCLCSYNNLLGVLVKANRVSLAEAIFNQIVKEGEVNPDVYTYTTMIRGYCKMGLVKKAKRFFDGMGCAPNVFMYNTMINGFCKKGLMRDANEVLDRMRSGGCLPDTITFTTLIDGYCKSGEFEEAMICMDEMMKQKCEPNVLTYNAVINGLCLSGNVEEAKRMMTRMRLNGLKDNIATHTSMLKGLCIAGKSEEAATYLREMVSLGMKLDVKSYGVVVNEYCKMGKHEEAIALLEEMRMRGVNPSVSSFNAVFRILVESEKLDRAISLLKHMSQMGCSPNCLSYSTVIFGLCRTKGRMQQCKQLVYEMLENGHNLDASMYSCLVEGYCQDGDQESAVCVFHEAVDKGYVISLEAFLVLAKELTGKGMQDDVEKLLDYMSKSSLAIDVDRYRGILDDHSLVATHQNSRQYSKSRTRKGVDEADDDKHRSMLSSVCSS